MSAQTLSFYEGAYSIEISPRATKSHLPMRSVSVNGNMVSVPRGTVRQVMGGIQFYADGHPFSWGYNFIRCIRDSDGNVLWKNWNN